MRWLPVPLVGLMHHSLILEHGGARGVRDAVQLSAALARPRNLYAYESADVYRLAAAYAFGIARNHPFVDGNKRTALMAMYTFLRLNGVQLGAREEDAYLTMMQVAEGALTEPELAAWIKQHSQAP